MKPEIKRLFISDLPEQINEQDLQSKFADYGRIASLEIKERKNIGPKNNSRYFAYINLETDSINLQKCLKTVPKTKWKGYFVDVQIARENFLDRLKKEREESHNAVQKKKVELKTSCTEINGTSNGFTPNKRYYDSDDGEDLMENKYEKILVKTDPDIVIKDNRNKINNKSKKLKIESVGNEPVLIIEPKKPKSKDPKRMEAEMKRIQSVMQMKKEYNQQKNIIKTSLSNVDCKPKNKIVFDEDEDEVDYDNDFNHKETVSNDSNNEKKSKTLFSDDEEDETNLNFDVKEQFLGKKGQKLLQLQSRFKNDSRFKMDSRFLEEEEEENKQEENVVDEKITLEDEKQEQLKILGEVLGTNVAPRQKPSENHKMKSVLRFDPTQPEHSKYEVKPTVSTDKNKKKSKKVQSETNKIEENKPEVSKETFYKVTSDLKEALQEKESFSLLSVFGKADDEDKNENECISDAVEKPAALNKFATPGDNPFRYDSSDDESEDLEKNDEITQKPQVNPHWNEMFFFKDDDYRFQEGYDFIKRLEVGSNEEFSKMRTDLKQIIKTKVRNNLRKNKPFKKKLGGSKNKKRIRIKRALKR